MQDRYLITVIGEQTIEDESDKIEVITSGDCTSSGGRVVITYPEYAEDNPNIKTDTTITYDSGMLTIERRGEMSSRLILEEGRRHQCLYETPMGQIMIGIFTDSIRCAIGEHGGEISAAYRLDFSGTTASYNKFHITIKEKG